MFRLGILSGVRVLYVLWSRSSVHPSVDLPCSALFSFSLAFRGICHRSNMAVFPTTVWINAYWSSFEKRRPETWSHAQILLSLNMQTHLLHLMCAQLAPLHISSCFFFNRAVKQEKNPIRWQLMINAWDCSEVTFLCVSHCFAMFPCTSPKSTSLSYSGTIEKRHSCGCFEVRLRAYG